MSAVAQTKRLTKCGCCGATVDAGLTVRGRHLRFAAGEPTRAGSTPADAPYEPQLVLARPTRGGLRIVRHTLALWPVTALTLYWLADFNTYTDISGQTFVAARSGSAYRCAYAVGAGLACAILTAAALRSVGRNALLRLVAIVVAFTAILFAVADLNLYVGSGPEGQDWVKHAPRSGAERLTECAVLGSVLGTFAWLLVCGTEPLSVPATQETDSTG